MKPLRRTQSFTHVRKYTESTDLCRIQAQLDSAMTAFQPYSPKRAGTPPLPDYVNEPKVGTPLDGTRTTPSTPVSTLDAARNGRAPPPVPLRIGRVAGPIGPAPNGPNGQNPNRFAFTPIPNAPQGVNITPPPLPARDPVINRPVSTDLPTLLSR